MDASEMGVGARLSMHFRDKPKLQPVTLFSKKNLSPAQQNYDIGHCGSEAYPRGVVTTGLSEQHIPSQSSMITKTLSF